MGAAREHGRVVDAPLEVRDHQVRHQQRVGQEVAAERVRVVRRVQVQVLRPERERSKKKKKKKYKKRERESERVRK